jgi:hypothetical protein
VIVVDDNICFILSWDELSYCITTTRAGERSNPVGLMQVRADVRTFRWESVFTVLP